MHSLETIHTRNDHQTMREMRDAVADDNWDLARAIAKANPDLFTMDGRRKHVSEDGDVRAMYDDQGGES